jgi:hypothetical protein
LVENGKFVDVPGIATDITEKKCIGTYFQRSEQGNDYDNNHYSSNFHLVWQHLQKIELNLTGILLVRNSFTAVLRIVIGKWIL